MLKFVKITFEMSKNTPRVSRFGLAAKALYIHEKLFITDLHANHYIENQIDEL